MVPAYSKIVWVDHIKNEGECKKKERIVFQVNEHNTKII